MKHLTFSSLIICLLTGCLQTISTPTQTNALVVMDKFEFYEDNYLMYDQKTTQNYSVKRYAPKNNGELLHNKRVDIYYSESYKNKKHFDKFIDVRKKEYQNSKDFFHIDNIGENKVFQTVIYYPDDNQKHNGYEINLHVIELKKCGLTEFTYKHLFDKNISENEIKKFVSDRKTDMVQNMPLMLCK